MEWRSDKPYLGGGGSFRVQLITQPRKIRTGRSNLLQAHVKPQPHETIP